MVLVKKILEYFKNKNRKIYVRNAVTFIISYILLQFLFGFFILVVSQGGLSSWPNFLVKIIGIVGLIIIVPVDIMGFIIGTILIGSLISIFFTWCYNKFFKKSG